MSGDVTDTPPPRFSIGAYWLTSIQRMAAGAAIEGVGEDDIYEAVLKGLEEAQRAGR